MKIKLMNMNTLENDYLIEIDHLKILHVNEIISKKNEK